MPSLILVRHAQASFGAADYDVLSDLGHEQVKAAAAAVAERAPRIERVVSGTQRRQLDTAAPIAEAAGLELQVDERWNEYDSDALLAHHSATEVRLEKALGDDAPPITSRQFQTLLEAALFEWIAAGDDGHAGETWPAFSRRVGGALTDAARGLGSGATAVVCTSGGVIATVCASLLGADATAIVPFNRVTLNAGLTKVIVGRGGMTLVSFNEHGHLEGPGGLLTYR